MTPTGHSDRVQPSIEPRVVGSLAVDLALPLIPVFVVFALWQPLFTLGVVAGAVSTRLILGHWFPSPTHRQIGNEPPRTPDMVNR